MIGSLIYYGLYPLTKLIFALSELVGNSHPMYFNGKPLFGSGGDGSLSRTLNEQRSAWLGRWCSTDSEPCETMEDVPKEKEQVALTRHRKPTDIVESPEMKTQKSTFQPMELGSATDEGFPADLSSYPAVEKNNGIPAYSDANTLLERTDVSKESESNDCTLSLKQTDFETFTNENLTEDTGGTEGLVSVGNTMYDRNALLPDNHTEILNNYTWLQSAPTGWHFPVEFGLAEVAHCPIVHFPRLSYYPAFQHSNSFEVMWRVWEDLSENMDDSLSAFTDPESKFDFTVMSYNILAQDLLEANSSLYMHCSKEVLAWENRFNTIVKELQTWQPDIICLQEVQEDHFLKQMHPVLTELGYSCVYKRRTGNKTDGCALCYHAGRFTRLSVSLLEFWREEIELLDRDNVGIVLLLQPIAAHSGSLTFSPICVANTHLLFNPRRGEVKLAQLAIVLAEIDSMVKKCEVQGHNCEIILCGDFNSVPNMPLYQLITTGQLYYHGLPAWMVSGQEDLSYKTYHKRLYAPLWPSSLGINDECQYSDVIKPHVKESAGKIQYSPDFLWQLRFCPAACVRPSNLQLIPGVTDNIPTPDETWTFTPRCFRNTLYHSLNLRSAYSPDIAGPGHGAVTTLHSGSSAMVDYIFFSTGSDCKATDKQKGLKLLGRLSLLSEADLWSLNGLPNQTFPSDHLSLLAKFQLC